MLPKFRIIEWIDGNKDSKFYPEYSVTRFFGGWKRFEEYDGRQGFKTFKEANEWLCKRIKIERAKYVTKTKVHKPDLVFAKLTNED